MEKSRFKRRDYIEIRHGPRDRKNLKIEDVRPTLVAHPNANEPLVDIHSSQSAHYTSAEENDVPKKTFSLNLELPYLRRPPDSGDISKNGVRWAVIIGLGLIFFWIGYSKLWNITHSPRVAAINTYGNITAVNNDLLR